MRILTVDDDRELIELLGFGLRRAGFTQVVAYDAPTALERFKEDAPDLIVLDLNLAGWDGMDVLRRIRNESDIPIIIVTGRYEEDDRVRGLEMGADDYVVKPFSHRELIARIRAQLRRRHRDTPLPGRVESLLEVGPLRMNVTEHTVSLHGEPLQLTVTEFRLLHQLMINAGAVVPADLLLRQVWGYEVAGGTDVLRVTVYRLRKKLGEDPSQPQLLHTVPGLGLILKAPPEKAPPEAVQSAS